jgi:phosphoenolpyruvate synthase/pyruvate phosphate dikinase
MMASGTVTPDTIIVDRWSLDVLDYTPGEDESAVGAAAITELVQQSLEVERQFGGAVDIEAARAGGRWYLLQARPITTR